MAKRKKLPTPECSLGYTDSQVKAIMGTRLKEFNSWMSGQTMAVCDGRVYDHVKGAYEPSECGPHGGITYTWDLQRFLDGRPIVD
jgi:hypothetical protein